jgi:hypothetical protein
MARQSKSGRVAGLPGTAPPEILGETLAALAYHVTALAEVLRQLERTVAMAGSDAVADAGHAETARSAGRPDTAPGGRQDS